MARMTRVANTPLPRRQRRHPLPLTWLDRAIERWKDFTEKLATGEVKLPEMPKTLGVDVGRFGSDSSVRTHRQGAYVRWQRVTSQEDTMATTSRVSADLTEHPDATAQVDVIGLGAGVLDRLVELGHQAVGINVVEAASDPDRFANQRAEYYWGLRQLFEANEIVLPDEEELATDLTQLRYKVVNSNGKIRIEEKDEMKKRLKRSPDRAASLMLAYALPPEGPTFSCDVL
jgi:phage terminase large subunit